MSTVTTAGPQTGQRLKYVGTSVKRVEDRRLVMGKGTYMEDLSPLPNIHHAAIVRSPYAHARINGVDYAEALKVPGVVTVLTGADVKRWSRPFPVGIETPVNYYSCAVEKARYVGEPVAVVIANDRYVAEDAADLVEVDYEPLPAGVDAEAMAQSGAPVLHEEAGTNLCVNRIMRFGDPDRAFAAADLVVSDRFVFPKYGSTPMENFAAIGQWDAGQEEYTIWSNFHGPFSMHPVTAGALMVPENKLRFICPKDIGGGFGIKSSVYPMMALMALAARKAGVPVKWIEDRREHLLSGSSSADRIAYAELAFRKDGTLIGYRQKWYDNVGAYMRAPEPACSFRTMGNYVGPYQVKDVALHAMCVHTNKMPTGPMRGYGCQQLYWPPERLMDVAAEKLGLTPVEIRMKNVITADMMPYTNPTGGVYDSGDYPRAIKMALELAEYDKLLEEQKKARAEGRLYGVCVSLAVDPSVSNMGYITVAFNPTTRAKPTYKPKAGANETCQIRVDPLGKITVLINSVPEGQGHETIAAMIVAEELQLTPQEIAVVAEFDTQTRNWSITAGSYSSRFASVNASAIAGAARELKRRVFAVAAYNMGCQPEDLEIVQGGVVQMTSDPSRNMKLHHVLGLPFWNQRAIPEGIAVGGGFNVTYTFAFEKAAPPDEKDRVQSSNTYGFIAEVVAIELDPESYKLKFHKYVTVHDAGIVINPMIMEGQIYGGVAHGIGGALYEEMAYDEDGQALAGTFMDYLCPTALEVPELTIGHIESPSPWTLLGSKGAGESSAMTAPVAIGQAVADALKPLGVTINDLPVYPSRLYTQVQAAKS